MALNVFLALICLFSFFLEASSGNGVSRQSELATYTIFVRKQQGTDAASEHQPHILYSYQHIISSFSARLNDEDVNAMKDKDGFVSAFPEWVFHKQKTRTPLLLGLHQDSGFWKGSNFGKGVIFGLLDGGVFPSHPSFSGKGMPPPPAKRKGKCEFVGARSLNVAAKALKEVNMETLTQQAQQLNANVLGNAKGTAVGMATYAHLNIDKVCFGPACPESDILAGLDAAVADGVDVVSISLGQESQPFFNNSMTVAAFAATQKGIFVGCGGGNSGPLDSIVINEAPWMLAVGASTIDRSVEATIKLGNCEEFDGESFFQPKDFLPTQLPLVFAGSNGNPNLSLCYEGSMKGIGVKGKVVLCERGEITRILKGEIVKDAGGAAMILMNQQSDGFSTLADPHFLPASHVSYAAGLKISYINLAQTPVAAITFKGTVIGNPLAPTVVSSRGPSIATPGILKPDIIGPEVSILAANGNPANASTNAFSIMSGTSMSCPHLSGVTALLKNPHPLWSTAAIKSPIMASADLLNIKGTPIVDQTLNPADNFATGAGHVNSPKVNDPGRVYDIQPDDYIPYLCTLGYTDEQVGTIARKEIKCSDESSITEGEQNYPTFAVSLGSPETFTRTVTNVGEPNSSYSVKITTGSRCECQA